MKKIQGSITLQLIAGDKVRRTDPNRVYKFIYKANTGKFFLVEKSAQRCDTLQEISIFKASQLFDDSLVKYSKYFQAFGFRGLFARLVQDG